MFDFVVFFKKINEKINFHFDNNKNNDIKYEIYYRNKNLKHLLNIL